MKVFYCEWLLMRLLMTLGAPFREIYERMGSCCGSCLKRRSSPSNRTWYFACSLYLRALRETNRLAMVMGKGSGPPWFLDTLFVATLRGCFVFRVLWLPISALWNWLDHRYPFFQHSFIFARTLRRQDLLLPKSELLFTFQHSSASCCRRSSFE